MARFWRKINIFTRLRSSSGNLLVALLASLVLLGLTPSTGFAGLYRNFDGFDDRITTHTGGAMSATGHVTMVALIRPADTTVHTEIFGVNRLKEGKLESTGYGLQIGPSNTQQILLTNGTNSVTSNFKVNSNEWQLVAVTKDTGAKAIPRFHVYRFDLKQWIHENGSTTLGSSGSVQGGRVRLGVYETDDGADVSKRFYKGGLAAAAVFSYVMSDATVEALASSYTEWLSASAKAMWILNQKAVPLSSVEEKEEEEGKPPKKTPYPVLDETKYRSDQLEESSNQPEVASVNPPPLTGDPDGTVFRGDFRHYPGTFEQWGTPQKNPVGGTSSITLFETEDVLYPYDNYMYFARFSLLSKGDYRAELPSDIRFRENDDVYIRFWARLGAGFPTNEGWQLIWQLHQGPDEGGSPPLALEVISDGTPHFAVTDENMGEYWEGPEISTGVWNEFVIRVHHSSDPEVGFIEVWMNGFQQTLANGKLANEGTRVYCETLTEKWNYPKTGYYRSAEIAKGGVLDIADYEISKDPL
jgi:Polysaccharide lyase